MGGLYEPCVRNPPEGNEGSLWNTKLLKKRSFCRDPAVGGMAVHRTYVEKMFDMNHLFDTDPESCQKEDPKDLKLLEILIDKTIKRLEENSCEPKIRDALKAIQLKQKVVKTSEAEKIFWQEIENIRREELPKLYPDPMNPDGLEAQLLTTITGLKHHLKNGILPLKTIADAFNQGRSKESRLSYHRIARLLSAIGFRKVKTHGGCSAIIWDDKLLSQNTFSDADNSCPLDG
jgi:hypothetical protein